MKSKKKTDYPPDCTGVVIAIGAWMFKIGRGHTVYFDNKELTTDEKKTPSLFGPLRGRRIFQTQQPPVN